jgi:hypothetical protein
MKASMLRKWDPKSMSRPRDASPPSAPAVPARPVEIQSLGRTPWTGDVIRASMAEFLGVYRSRPETDASSGILSPDAFALWFMLRALGPSAVVESGVDKGLSTWILEQSVSGADLICLCPDPSRRQYVSGKARYAEEDFLDFDLSGLARDPASMAVLFDDHRDVFPRIERCAQAGIKHLLFHGNYPEFVGHRHVSIAACLNGRKEDGMHAFPDEKKFLLERCETYFIFPPPFDHAEPVTLEKTFIKVKSLCGAFREERDGGLRPFRDDMGSYRWTSYLKLK